MLFPILLVVFGFCVIAFFLLLRSGKLSKLFDFQKLSLDGLILIKSLKFSDESIEDNKYKENFKTLFKEINNKYDFFNHETDYDTGMISIKLRTQDRVIIKGDGILDEFVEDLNRLIGILPSNEFLIKVKLKGYLKSIIYSTQITIANKSNLVGINKQKRKRIFFFRFINTKQNN